MDDRRTEMVDGPTGPLEVHVQGDGPAVLMIPSLGRGAVDFDRLAADVARAGYRALVPEPRGISRSNDVLTDMSMGDLADDVAAVIDACGGGPATVIGHAFGNRVACGWSRRRIRTAVDGVILLACGGLIPPSAEASAALLAVFDPTLPPDEHLAAVRTAFFAPGNDPTVWVDGWHGDVAAAQGAATRSTPVEVWWAAGRADVLVVQPTDDVIAAVANAEHIVALLDGRATMVVVPGAGHALLPEQPELVSAAVVEWLDHRRAPAEERR